jgi:hypothetical protein
MEQRLSVAIPVTADATKILVHQGEEWEKT